jgi:hypothetical protein
MMIRHSYMMISSNMELPKCGLLNMKFFSNKKLLKFATPDLDAMEWSHPLPHYVGCVA